MKEDERKEEQQQEGGGATEEEREGQGQIDGDRAPGTKGSSTRIAAALSFPRRHLKRQGECTALRARCYHSSGSLNSLGCISVIFSWPCFTRSSPALRQPPNWTARCFASCSNFATPASSSLGPFCCDGPLAGDVLDLVLLLVEAHVRRRRPKLNPLRSVAAPVRIRQPPAPIAAAEGDHLAGLAPGGSRVVRRADYREDPLARPP